ncbi:hypothetical protein Tco_0932401 [Tanacetum coccineum]
MLRGLSTNTNCHKIIRMSVDAFKILCQKLENQCGLRPTQRMSVEEQVARFLHIVGNDFRTRFVSWLYRRFVSSTSRHFHKVLNAIISLEDQYIKQATGNIVQKEIHDKPRFYPFFKDCIGAIDGTHVRVRVPNRDTPRYRGRTASDSGIIKDALTRDDKLLIPDGKYYLVDGGLPHRSTLIAPYRGVDHDKELKDEVIHEMLDASHDEERKGPRDTDDRGEQIRISIANDMWSDYMLHPNNEINMSN